MIISGVEFPSNLKITPFQAELFLFYYGNQLAANPYWRPKGSVPGMLGSSDIPYTGDGRFEHFKNIAQALFPKTFQWHDWSEKAGRAFCENRSVAICGAGGSGKSTTAGLYALIWMLAAPNDSAVLIASTSIDAAKKRIWKNIRQYYTEMVKLTRKVGETVLIGNPRPCIRASKTDTAHGIYVVAVAKGEVEKGVEALKGFHPKRLLMIGDETDSIGQAVVDVGVNQEIGTIEYQSIWLGNDPSLFNPLGKIMQPEIGKPVTLGNTEWTSANGTYCLRFDAFESPNVKEGGEKYHGIVSKKNIDQAIKERGENHPQIWIMLRGIHPPEGADDTVLSEALFLRNHCQNSVTWKTGFQSIGLLDPAFGGDRCIFRTMDYGMDTANQMKILVGQPIEIQIDGGDTQNPPEYQIAQKVKSLCESKGIKPQDFVMDGSGTGRGTAAVLQREWGSSINVIQFGGACTEMPTSDEDSKPANEAYDRLVTELWYSFRVFVEAGMIRGLDPQTAMEFCARKFYIKAKKISVETKPEMKLRGAMSPDLADCVVCGIHLLRERGINATVQTTVKQENTRDWDRKVIEGDIDSWEGNYSSALADMGADVY